VPSGVKPSISISSEKNSGQALKSPSTSSVAPVMKAVSELARKHLHLTRFGWRRDALIGIAP